MTTTDIDRARVERLLQAICERLGGDWLLIGGALVAVWIEPRRVTEDVDLVGLGGTEDERLRLMDLAVSLGLPVESVNSAADFFVRRIADWRDHIEPLRQGSRGRVFRPDPTLFLLLKIGRLDERDLDDCLRLLRVARKQGWSIDVNRVVAEIDGRLSAVEGPGRARHAKLRRALSVRTGTRRRKQRRRSDRG